jgi:hypothetical protein
MADTLVMPTTEPIKMAATSSSHGPFKTQQQYTIYTRALQPRHRIRVCDRCGDGEHAPFIAYVDSKCSHFSVCQCCDSQHTDQCAQSERDSDANAPSDCYHCLASRPHRILVSPVKMCVRKPGQFVVGRPLGSIPSRASTLVRPLILLPSLARLHPGC